MANTVGAIAVCLALWTPAHAQTLGTITGDVKDASGALPGATVTAQNIATNAVRTQQSNEVVKAELDGFRLAQNRVEPHVEETLRVTLSLEIGGITETTEAPFIRIMLSNHAHFVHVSGHALMQRRTGAQVMAMAGTPKRCRAATTRRRSAPSGGSRCRWRACRSTACRRGHPGCQCGHMWLYCERDFHRDPRAQGQLEPLHPANRSR